MMLDLDGNGIRDDTRASYLERFLHAKIYRRRPDVGAVVHGHAHSIIPFSLVKEQPMKPVYHMATGMGATVPIFEIRDRAGDASDLLIRDAELGAALAEMLGESTLVVMRGHGMTVAARTLREASSSRTVPTSMRGFKRQHFSLERQTR